MVGHEHFLARIQSESGEGLRLAQSIYADWLEEQGDPRAELLRLAVEIRGYEPRFIYWDGSPEGGDSLGNRYHAIYEELEPIPGWGIVAFEDWCHSARLPELITWSGPQWGWDGDYRSRSARI